MIWSRRVAPGVVALLALAGCSSDEPADDGKTLTVAIPDNADLQRMKSLVSDFTAKNPGVRVSFVTLAEGELRQKVTTDVAAQGGQYDVVALGAYETEIWSEKDFLEPMTGLPSSYDVGDLLPNIRSALTAKDALYALPFYGESSFTMYRKDVFKKAGLTMPAKPTWEFMKSAAKKLSTVDGGDVCLRGKAGWGENVAFLTAMANSYGGRWFNQDWKPQLETPAWKKALNTYVALGKHAPESVASNGYNENLQLFRDGKCALWVDSTVAGSTLTAQDDLKGKVGYAPAPGAGESKDSSWLWAWSLAVPTSSNNKAMAKKFATWATSPEYTELVADEHGWANVPPGARKSLYQNQEYLKAAPFARQTERAINASDARKPTVDPVPYVGIQYVAIPEFQGIGTAVGNRATKALTGDIDSGEALSNAQWVTTKVMGKQDRQAEK
ncbi:ABC transporter substrate-binding protein [Demetria terragena]|uniref:ABC transporter substrate-binding protein n=1 Tax=Demetria terragena TaxID=63959 RepID=UPI00039996A3|nr:sugar ABC transporter substrate-binding protein [Demetria terragena]